MNRRQAPLLVREDFSKAPPPEGREIIPQHHILVLGDAMADWLAYGLKDAYSERPDMGVSRTSLHEPAAEKTKKIDEMIGVLRSKSVPFLWVGLPVVRGPKATSDTLFLDALYRDAAGKAGITYIDVWDGFVDEAGRFQKKGPDFEGQIRQLRSLDGVYFTKAGARKLAHYVEREITRILAARTAPVALPIEPATPDAVAIPGQPVRRPLAGPIVPLVAPSVSNDQLLGGPGSAPAAVDALTARTLIKGEALIQPAGRANDFAWPRREIGREPADDTNAVASASADHVRDGHAMLMAPAALPKSKRLRR